MFLLSESREFSDCSGVDANIDRVALRRFSKEYKISKTVAYICR